MPDLNCTVVSCTYNKTERCCKEDIQVDGPAAKVTEETCCASFRPRKGDSFTNAAKKPDIRTGVRCEAKECAYNDSCVCKAEKIGIVGGHACDCRETECATFTCR